MRPTATFVALTGFLQAVISLPNVSFQNNARELEGRDEPPIIAPLTSDFQKNNVSASWAEGHPKIWGAEERLYEMPVPLGQSLFDAYLSTDGKFLALSNSSDVRIIKVETNATVSTTGHSSTGKNGIVELRSAPGGQYDLIVSSSTDFDNKVRTTTQIRLSAEGVPIDQPIVHAGDLSPVPGTPFSKDGRRMIAQLGSVAHVYDLDDPTIDLTLSGHTDEIMNGAFSPDGKYVATTSRDTYTKVWDAQSGKLVQDIGPMDDRNAFVVFSPDGKSLLVSTEGGRGSLAVVKLWSTGNLTTQTNELGPFYINIAKAVFSPNSELLAISDNYEFIQIVRLSDLQIVQEWKPQWRVTVEELTWLEDGKKIAYRYLGGLEVYDFETNLKYRWAAGEWDHYTSAGRKIFVLGNNKMVGGVDGDQKVRFWPYPI